MKMSVLVTYTFLLLLDVSRALVPVVVRHGNLQRPRPLRMQELGSTREEGAASDPPGLPPFLASRISFQTGGFKQPNQEEETLILWNTFKKCYATEADAEAAVNKNSMTVNPSMNSPSKISGTFALLKERFGLDEARRIVMANPGILTCTRQAVEKQTDDDIMKATEFVALVDKNKGLVKFLVGSSFFAFFPLVGWRIGNVRGWW